MTLILCIMQVGWIWSASSTVSSLYDLAFDTLSENKAENELSQLICVYIKFYLYYNVFISSFRKVYHKKKACGLFLTATDIFIFKYFLWIQIIKF